MIQTDLRCYDGNQWELSADEFLPTLIPFDTQSSICQDMSRYSYESPLRTSTSGFTSKYSTIEYHRVPPKIPMRKICKSSNDFRNGFSPSPHAHASDHGRFRGFSDQATYWNGLFTSTSLKIPWISDAPFQQKNSGKNYQCDISTGHMFTSFQANRITGVTTSNSGLTGDLVISSVCRTATRQVTRKAIASSLAWSGPANPCITKCDISTIWIDLETSTLTSNMDMSTLISNISFILKFAWKQVPCLQTPGILHLDPNMSYHQLCSDMLQAIVVGPLPSFTNAGGSVHSMRIGVGYILKTPKEAEIWETAKPPGWAQYPTLFREHLGQLQPLADCPKLMWYPWLRQKKYAG